MTLVYKKLTKVWHPVSGTSVRCNSVVDKFIYKCLDDIFICVASQDNFLSFLNKSMVRWDENH